MTDQYRGLSMMDNRAHLKLFLSLEAMGRLNDWLGLAYRAQYNLKPTYFRQLCSVSAIPTVQFPHPG